jgi:uncharacterized protein (DUF2126 family)
MHRAEINIEKLWNPLLGARGLQGIVEFRSFRMGPTPETTAAFAALLRGIVAMLIEAPRREPLVRWGEELHQRFSLPFYLHEDLASVLAELDEAAFGLAQPLASRLLRDDDLIMTREDLVDAQLEIRRAVEFWPLVGDVATQERGGSRLIDASTARIEIRLRTQHDPDDWNLACSGWRLPMRAAEDADGPVRLTGLRYRNFVPYRGLHPTLGNQSPVVLTLSHPRHGHWSMTLHPWDPDGRAYPGLPATLEHARDRRRARCVLQRLDGPPPSASPPREEAVGSHVIDLRWR